MNGYDLIRAERIRQVHSERYTAEHDAGHATELALAAFGYAQHAAATLVAGYTPEQSLEAGAWAGPTPDEWPWRAEDWKPTGDPIRDLVKSGALIAAAIDVLQSERIAAGALDARGFDFSAQHGERVDADERPAEGAVRP